MRQRRDDRPGLSSGRVRLSDEVAEALQQGLPVVALETAVVTHGLPPPHNVEVAAEMETAVRAMGAVPATCLVTDNRIHVGASSRAAERAANDPNRQKASVRDLATVLTSGRPAGLTVSATLFVANQVGIHVFATGGIGGVHVGAELTGDISTDLPQLARSRVITVCAGSKSVLDIPRTLEFLETEGVPVFAYQSDDFPAFYLRSSGVQVTRLESAQAVAEIARVQWEELEYDAGLVVGNPVPTEEAIAEGEWNQWMERAAKSATQAGIRGKDVTPYLLSRVAEYSGGRTVETNVSLLRRNAALASEIAVTLAG